MSLSTMASMKLFHNFTQGIAVCQIRLFDILRAWFVLDKRSVFWSCLTKRYNDRHVFYILRHNKYVFFLQINNLLLESRIPVNFWFYFYSFVTHYHISTSILYRILR
jgi:hypothetical protein